MNTAKALKTTPQNFTTYYGILIAIGASHLFNDAIQAVVPAMNPIFEQKLHLTYSQIGWIAFVINMTSSVMQPIFGYISDRRPTPFLLPFAMILSMIGLIGFALSPNYYVILLSVFFIGIGSAVFHPEGSRVAYMAAGERRGLAQSIYQVGGNFGGSLAPIFTALIFVNFGQKGALGFTIVALLGAITLFFVSKWYQNQLVYFQSKGTENITNHKKTRLHPKLKLGLIVLVLLVFVRSWSSSGISNFYQFYLIGDYGITIKQAQVYIFIFMIAGVLGTFLGGPLADRFGRKNMLFFSMAGAAPLTILLPYAPLTVVAPLFFLIGFIINSSFSIAVVYAQELVPNKIGMMSGLIVGFAFGMGAIGAVLLGFIADLYSIRSVMILCSILPVFGLLTWLLPKDELVKQLNS